MCYVKLEVDVSWTSPHVADQLDLGICLPQDRTSEHLRENSSAVCGHELSLSVVYLGLNPHIVACVASLSHGRPHVGHALWVAWVARPEKGIGRARVSERPEIAATLLSVDEAMEHDRVWHVEGVGWRREKRWLVP